MEGLEQAKPDGFPHFGFCPGGLRNPGIRDDRIVFRRGHQLFDNPALGEFFGGTARGVSDQVARNQGTPVESQIDHKKEYGRA